MDDKRRPRHIRDIAHLYLSRSRPKTRSVTLNLCVAARSRDDFPALHVANLAAAFSRRRARVRIFELSGLLPNACFYFSHAPRVHLPLTRMPLGPVPGLNSIDVTFSPEMSPARTTDSVPLTVRIVHLPTLERAGALREAFHDVDARLRGHTWLLLLGGARDGEESAVEVFGDGFDGARAFSITTRGSSDGGRPTAALGDLGALEPWRYALADRVPIVFRSPEATLSRCYLSICDSLLGKITTVTKAGATHVAGTTGTRHPVAR